MSASAQGAANAPLPPGPRIVLLLPARGSRYADAGDAVRRGFLAAREVAGDTVAVDTLETDETAAQLLPALDKARERGAEVVIGPLTRDAVNAVVDANRELPLLVTLSYPDRTSLPPAVLAFGFSIEQEASQVARTALGVDASGATTAAAPQRLLIVSGHAPLQRRGAEAFRRALIELGQQPTVIEPSLDPGGLATLAARVKEAPFDQAFLALDAREAGLVRPRLIGIAKLWATSQVDPGGALAQARAGELTGIRFADMPWMIEPEQPQVASYPRPRLDDGSAVPVDLDRLYALGIDAYRLAKIWATGSTQFEISGVTGLLSVDRNRSGRVERFLVFAVFRQGRIQREDAAP